MITPVWSEAMGVAVVFGAMVPVEEEEEEVCEEEEVVGCVEEVVGCVVEVVVGLL